MGKVSFLKLNYRPCTELQFFSLHAVNVQREAIYEYMRRMPDCQIQNISLSTNELQSVM